MQPNINVAKQKGKIYVIQAAINFINHKNKIANKYKNNIYISQTNVKFDKHKCKIANKHKNKKGKRSSMTPLLDMVELEGKGQSDFNAAYSLICCR